MDDVAKKYYAYAYEPSGKLTDAAAIDHILEVIARGLLGAEALRSCVIP